MNGKENELDLINVINNAKNLHELSESLRDFIEFAFNKKNITDFKCEQVTNNSKPDLLLIHDSSIKYLSVKKGEGNSVHQESLKDFIIFLRKNGFDSKIIDSILRFHFGDNTLDGTGLKRYSASECKKIYADEIVKVNGYINNNPNLLHLLIDRFLFQGNIENGNKVDFLYHGDKTKGVWASYDEVIKFIKSQSFNKEGIHFGPLTYQVWGRDNQFSAIHPERRYIMQVKWGSISDDLTLIRSREMIR